jgi:hypothetical protein
MRDIAGISGAADIWLRKKRERNASFTGHGQEVPQAGHLQLFRLEKLHEFQCVWCQAVMKSKLVGVQGGD